MPNTIAYLALLLWPLVVLVLFHRLPPGKALIWSVLGAYMVLPEGTVIDPPALPPFDKTSITILACWLAAWGLHGQRVSLLPKDRIGRLLAGVYLLMPLVSVLNNGIALPRVENPPLPGLRIPDVPSLMLQPVFALMLLGMARSFLTTREDLTDLLRAFIIAGLIYSPLMITEVVLSPQLSTWVYGFFPHDFQQMMRQGGFRPIVFMPHGLWVAFFAAMALWAAASLSRSATPEQRPAYIWMTLWFIVLLILCKSLGVLIYSIFLIPVLLFLPLSLQMRIALVLVALALLYPVFRASPLFPDLWLVEMAGRINPDRAQSLEFRLVNEGVLLEHANVKPLTGWGGFGRNLLYSQWDGRVITVTDGRWIIALGFFGWPGFFAEFGLLALPILRVALRRAVPLWSGFVTLSLILAVNMVDLLPNATLTTLTWLMAGALWGGIPPDTRSIAKIRDPGVPVKRTLI